MIVRSLTPGARHTIRRQIWGSLWYKWADELEALLPSILVKAFKGEL